MRVCVTGNCGMIGSRLVNHLLTKPEVTKIIGLDDLSGGYLQNLPTDSDKFEFYNVDVSNPTQTTPIFQNNIFDIVYHAAAWAAEAASPFARLHTHKTNIISTSNIVNMCIEYDAKRLIYFSSMATYGNGIPPFSEDMTLNPIDVYGASKLCSEYDVRIAGEQHHLPYVIIVPHNVYSEGQIFDKYRNVLSIWMMRTLQNLPMRIYGDGLQIRSFTYTSDILEPLWVAGISEKALGHRINLGGIKQHSINDAAKIVRDVMDKGEIIYCEPRHEVKNAYSTWEKSVDLLGFVHKTDLETGVISLWKWAQQMYNQVEFKEAKLEITKGIYSYWKE